MTPSLLDDTARGTPVPSYPPIPICPGQAQDEPAYDFGLRIFRFLIEQAPYPVGLLTDEQRRAAMHFSQVAVTAKDVAPRALDQYHAIRSQLQTRIHDDDRQDARQARQTPAQAATATQDDRPNEGPMAPHRTPPTRPTPPTVRDLEPYDYDRARAELARF